MRRLSDTRSGLLGRRSPHGDLLDRVVGPAVLGSFVAADHCERARPHASAHIARRRRRSIEAWARIVGDLYLRDVPAASRDGRSERRGIKPVADGGVDWFVD
jgi:hypothetical protein